MAGKQIGYIRVSSGEQNTARQLDGIALDLHGRHDRQRKGTPTA